MGSEALDCGLRIANHGSTFVRLRRDGWARMNRDFTGGKRRKPETSADTKIFYLFGKVRTRLRRTTARQEGTGSLAEQKATRKRRLRAEKGFYSGLVGIAQDYSGLLRIAGCHLPALIGFSG